MIDAAVVGVPHKTLGEEVRAVVQLKPGSTTTAADLQRFCAEHLAANYREPGEYLVEVAHRDITHADRRDGDRSPT